jgi:hypothetical protein
LRRFGPLTRTEWIDRCTAAGVPKSSANSTAYILRDRQQVEQFDDETAGGLTKWRVK